MKRHGRGFEICIAVFVIAFGLMTACSTSNSSSEGGSCATNVDCEFGFRCLNTTCVSLECTHPRDCLTGEYCKFAIGEDIGICTVRPDETDGDVADGDVVDGDTDTAPIGTCNEGERRCRGDLLETCELFNGFLDFRFTEECQYGCQLGACNEPPAEDGDAEQVQVCEPGNMQCYSNQVQVCSEDGMEWTISDPCLQGTCVEEVQTGGGVLADCGPKIVCERGMRICDEEGAYEAVLICNDDGTDWTRSYCAANQACINGLCQSSTECTRGRYRCNGNLVEKCRDNGTGWDRVDTCVDGEETCACGQYAGSECALASCTKNAICSPLLDTRCSGDVVQRCDSSGTGWAFWSDCAAKDPPQTCVNGSCQ
jgi:hypothetical protein